MIATILTHSAAYLFGFILCTICVNLGNRNKEFDDLAEQEGDSSMEIQIDAVMAKTGK